MGEFVIENGVLKKYTGNGGTVVIPDGVTRIEAGVFEDCGSLSSITLPDSVTSIGPRAFYRCSSLKNLTIPDGVTEIEEETFRECISLTDVTIPDGVTSIGDRAFCDCNGLTSVTIPDSVTSIECFAFAGCNGLTSVTIPEGVTRIEVGVFEDCDSLSSITLPDSVTSIGPRAFYRCSSLKNLTIPDGVTEIGEETFVECIRLTDVTIPGGVTCIGVATFDGCSSLRNITLQNGVTYIGSHAFYECSDLTSITLPNSVTGIGYEAFKSCRSITDIKFSSSLMSIEHGAFSGCNSLTSITIPDSVASIGNRAFSNCKKLYSITLPGSIANIGKNVFDKCPQLSRIDTAVPLSATVMGQPSGIAVYCNDFTLLPKDWKLLAAVGFAEEHADVNTERGQAYLKYIKANAAKLEAYTEQYPSIKELILKATGAAKKTEKNNAAAFESEEKEYFALLGGEKAFKALNIPQRKLPKILRRDTQEYASDDLLKCLFLAYSAQYKRTKEYTCRRVEQADGYAALLEEESLQAGMRTLWDNIETAIMICPKAVLFFVRYGNSKLFSDVAKKCKGTWLEPSVNAGYLLNDSREAMVMADQKKELAKYAQMRGMTEDELIDRYFMDFGFDRQGVKQYHLGGTDIRVSITEDMQLELLNENTGKTVKTLPSKNTDSEKRQAAMDDLSDMRKNIKRVAKSKQDRLLADFLSGAEYAAEKWKDTFMENAVLRAIAHLLVWQQGTATFSVKQSGLIDSKGNAYVLTDKTVKVAHPLDMRPEEVREWQHYFSANRLKQPFEQIWEPVYTANEVKADRYEGVVVKFKYLTNRQKQGINAKIYVYDYGNEGGINDTLQLEQCKIGYELVIFPNAYTGNRYIGEDIAAKLGKFSFDTWNRQVNHIVYLLDRVTKYDRIRKDDVSVMNVITNASLPQITEYLRIAAESGSTNVTAELLEYKNAHFASFEPMDEFTLDW